MGALTAQHRAQLPPTSLGNFSTEDIVLFNAGAVPDHSSPPTFAPRRRSQSLAPASPTPQGEGELRGQASAHWAPRASAGRVLYK